MSDKQYKLLRKQLRNVVQGMLPDVLTTETFGVIEKKLNERLTARLDGITQEVKTTLDKIDERSKDIQSYVVRNSPIEQAPAPSPIEVVAPKAE